MMFTKQIILFASIFTVICATKEHMNDGALVGADGALATNQIYGQPIQDNIAAESEVAKRGAAASSSSASTSSSENQGQSSQIDVGSNSASGSNVISFSTPNSFQQFFSPAFGQYGQLGPFALVPSSSSTTPQIFYVRAPQQYVAPSGVGTIKLTYTSNQAQPQTSIQYASTTPKVAYAISPGQYVAAVATQPNPYSYAPVALASPYTTSAYTNANGYSNTAQLPAASLQQGQIIPYTTGSSNGILLSPSQLQQLNLAVPQTVGSAATVQPYTYTTATPILPNVPKVGTTVVTPTAAAYYSAAPASQTYQQTPTFLSYQNAGLNYATAQKLVAVPSYTQATYPQATYSQATYPQATYRPFVAPTAPTAASAYTNAYVQPTGVAPVKYTLAQPTGYYTAASGQSYQKLAYAPSVSATSSTPFVSSYQQSASQAYPSAQASNTNGAIQYASPIYQSNVNAVKYGYSQIPTAQKYFYAST